MKLRLLFLSLVSALALCAQGSPAWPSAGPEAKPWTRWWWPGSAVDKENLTRELEAFAAAGFGGVEITPIYGAKGAEDRFIPFLSDRYVEMLAHTASEAKRLGLRVDMATGTGWPFGGAHVSREDAEQKVDLADGKFVPRPSGFRVKRAAPGGAGFVLDPYSVPVLDRYLAPFTAAFSKLPSGALRGQFHDSFEYTGNWSNELAARFRELHGYDLADRAADLASNADADTVARIKSDYRAALASLHLDYVKRWTAWAHEQGQITRNQAHGAPGNLLDLYAASDIPETEIFGSSTFNVPGYRRDPIEIGRDTVEPLFLRFAPSAAHVSGKKLVSCETFTWLREHFHESPSQMKLEVDQLFLAGVNHIVYHGTAYSPSDAAWPGWLFYASTQFNSRNALWRDLAEGLNAYIARSQTLLQASAPDSDVLVYWPVHDLWHNPEKWTLPLTLHDTNWLSESSTGAVARELVKAGVQFDFISDAQLSELAVHEGTLRTRNGPAYRTLVLPRTAHLPLETLRSLADLVGAGARIVFVDSLPADVPGAGHLDKRRREFTELLTRLQGGATAVAPQASILDHLGSREQLADTGLSFLRRRVEGGNLYLIVNPTAQRFDDWAQLRSSGTSAVLMDARSGRSGTIAVRSLKTGISVRLQLEPGESIFVRTQTTAAPSSSPWAYTEPSRAPIALSPAWRVSFINGGPETPASFTTKELRSWADQGGEAERFAGTARYETEIEIPANVRADDWLLDLGDVRETARVFVNGKQVDLLWSLPFRTRIGAALKPGKNAVAIEVTNLSANRIRDMDARKTPWKNFHEINFVNIHYKPLDASQWTLMPSGLLGPVTLTPVLLPPAN